MSNNNCNFIAMKKFQNNLQNDLSKKLYVILLLAEVVIFMAVAVAKSDAAILFIV